MVTRKGIRMEMEGKLRMTMDRFHIPVLLSETINGLKITNGKKYIDATLGGGGHTRVILEKGGIVLGIDFDPEALEYVRENYKLQITRLQMPPATTSKMLADGGQANFKLKIIKGNFKDLKVIAQHNGFNKVAGILFDLGVSSHQLETSYRGFSFNTTAALDMRMDPDLQVTAADLINGLNEGELYELFNKYAEEFYSRAIARAIIRARAIKPVTTCDQLAQIIIRVRGKGRGERTHPATRIFQALRIAVNDELNNLKTALPQTIDLLERDGRLAIISFHSLEDRIVKNFFKQKEREGIFKIISQKPIRPSDSEVKTNSRSRSAKLRIAQLN